jgi:hypothetical protein
MVFILVNIGFALRYMELKLNFVKFLKKNTFSARNKNMTTTLT